MEKIHLLIIIIFYFFSAFTYFGYLIYQKSRLFYYGNALMLLGVIVHTAAIGLICVKTQNMPIQNLRTTLLFIGWLINICYFILQFKYPVKILGIYTAMLSLLLMVIILYLPGGATNVPILKDNVFLIIHIITILIGDAAFALACGVACLYLIQENEIKSKHRGFFYKRLPSLEFLDSAGYFCLAFGFLFLTLGLIAGFTHAKAVWGKFWSWDPKEVWSSITWIVYAILLHERLTVGWRGRRAAMMAIFGFLIVIFTFIGVNFLFKGHHQPFTTF